ncbi:MAG: hypothetical protein DRP29_08975 [Thermodesulfobacteriota bacterium]|nr:MAG: hypothetical protein DRP29_08975 [Thermodesulfobacteriota bacterium]
MDLNLLRDIYEDLKINIFNTFHSGKLEETLKLAIISSTFAWSYHFDVWYDDEIEELLKNIGKKILSTIYFKKNNIKLNSNSILFITTYFTDTGGHTETLKIWIQHLSEEFQKIYIVSTEIFNKTTEFESVNFLKKFATLWILSEEKSYFNKIHKLIEIICKVSPKYIVLFIDPNDAVTLSTLSALKEFLEFKIIFFNHADHVFWLGKNITDILVEFRSYSLNISKKFRNFSKKQIVIPLTTNINQRKIKNKKLFYLKEQAKSISISIGSPYKFVSDGFWDYFKVIEKILIKHPDHIHILITKPTYYIKKVLKSFSPEIRSRVKLIPGTSDPLPYYKIADFLIESFPVIGGTVRVEAIALGLPIIFIKNNFSGLFSITDAIPENYPYIAESNEDVLEYANLFITNKQLRFDLSKFLTKYFEENLSLKYISNYIKSLFKDGENTFSVKVKKFSIKESIDYLVKFDFLNKNYSPYLFLLRTALLTKCKNFYIYWKIFTNLSIKDLNIVKKLRYIIKK